MLSSPEFQVASAVSSNHKFLDVRNLTCLQPLPNGLYTDHSSLNHRSFRSVWTRKQNKSRCILGAFIVPLRYRTKTLQVYNTLQGFSNGISNEIKFSRIIFIECCYYTSAAWMQYVYYVKMDLFSTYVNEMPIKCLEKYLSRNLLNCYLHIDYEAWSYYMFNAPHERNYSFSTMNKIKCWNTPVLVDTNISRKISEKYI